MSEAAFWVLIFILIVMIVINTYAAVQHQQYMQQIRADVQQLYADIQAKDAQMHKRISVWLKPIDADVRWLWEAAHKPGGVTIHNGYDVPAQLSYDDYLVHGPDPSQSQPTNPMHSHVSRTDPMPVAVAPGPPSSRPSRSDSGGLMTQLPAMRRPAA